MENTKLIVKAFICILTIVVLNNCEAQVTPGFNLPNSACINSPITIQNTSVGASTFYWNFCASNYNASPLVENMGNPGNLFSGPVFMDFVKDQNNNYYALVTNYITGNLVRLSFGNSLLNTPSATNLGNFNGLLPTEGVEAVKIVFNENKWYALIVASNKFKTVSKMVKIDFGNSLTNASPTATDWGNFANFNFPVDFFLFKENNNWYAYVINKNSSTLSFVNFTTTFENIPTGFNIGNHGSLAYPAGIKGIKENGIWHIFIANSNQDPFGNNISGGSITRLDFGNGLIAFPTAMVNLGNFSQIVMARDISFVNLCENLVGLVADQTGKIIRLNFNNGVTGIPNATSLGTFNYYLYPHAISKPFRNGSDINFFVIDHQNPSLSRLKFQGCTNTDVLSSTAANPPDITFSSPGYYSISLTVDEGQPTEASVCKQIILNNCVTPIVIKNFQVNKSASGKNVISFETLDEASAKEIVVERAYGDMRFSSAESILLKGDRKYTFEDHSFDKAQAIVYYKLKIIGKSADVTYSEIKTLKTNNFKNTVTLVGNVFKSKISQLNIVSQEVQNVEVLVYDASGRLMVLRKVGLIYGKNIVDFSAEKLNSPGIYFVQIKSADENSTFRLLVQ